MYFVQQVHVDDRQKAVEDHKPGEAHDDVGRRNRRDAQGMSAVRPQWPRAAGRTPRRSSRAPRPPTEAGAPRKRSLKKVRLFINRRRVAKTKPTVKSPIKKSPNATIARNVQNMGPTAGTVSHAARSICWALACAGSSTYLRSSSVYPKSATCSVRVWRASDVARILPQHPKRGVGRYTIYNPHFGTLDELEYARHFLIG